MNSLGLCKRKQRQLIKSGLSPKIKRTKTPKQKPHIIMYVQQPLSLTLPYLVCLPNVDYSLYLGPRMLTLLQPSWSSSFGSVFLLPQNGREISPLLFPPLDLSCPTPLSSFHQNLIITMLCLGNTFRFKFKHNLFMQHTLTSSSSPHNFFLLKKPLCHNLFLYIYLQSMYLYWTTEQCLCLFVCFNHCISSA